MAWFGRKAGPVINEVAWVEDGRNLIAAGNSTFAFGLLWSVLGEEKEFKERLREAADDGFSHYLFDKGPLLLGVTAFEIQETIYSGALHLARAASKGGIEYFALAFQTGQHVVVALSAGLPIPGFDRSCSHEEACSLIEDLRALYPDESIRIIGNLPEINPVAKVEPERLFQMPSRSTRLKRVPSRTMRLMQAAAGFFLFMLALTGAYFYHQYLEEKKQEEKLLEQEAQKPNAVYESKIGSALANAGIPGATVARAWQSTLDLMPLQPDGWRLTQANCTVASCVGTWKRVYGNSKDFFVAFSAAETYTVEEIQVNTNPSSVEIKVTIPLALQASERQILERESLPTISDVKRHMTSMLQDLTVLEKAVVTLTQPSLFPASSNSASIEKPVLRSDWSVQHALWSLPDMTYERYMVPEQLEVIWPAPGKNTPTYTLKGAFYAKGKSY